MSGLTHRILKGVVIVCFGTMAPTDADWDRLLGTLIRQCHMQGSIAIVAMSRGGGPTALQRASLARLFGGFPFRIGIIQSGMASQPLLASLAWPQATAFVYTPDTLAEAADHFGLPVRDLNGCLAQLVTELYQAPPRAA
jgi:hypothetical protein